MSAKKSRMYKDVETWSPFVGCLFDCSYCKPSFQAQAKRQRQNCDICYDYTPHEHPKRLNKIKGAPTIFVCGNADISFAKPKFVLKIIEAIKKHNERSPHKTYYFQSKRPECFKPFLKEFPENVILLTTLETNRNKGYKKVSKAPVPSVRYKQFKNLKYPWKVVTVEPVMDFDPEIFSQQIIDLDPEYVWIGFSSHPKHVDFEEPTKAKVKQLIQILKKAKIPVKEKLMREAVNTAG